MESKGCPSSSNLSGLRFSRNIGSERDKGALGALVTPDIPEQSTKLETKPLTGNAETNCSV